MNETPVTVVGNVASDVTERQAGEYLVVGFRVLSNERRWDKATGTWVDGGRFSATVSCWRRLGERVKTSLAKGDPVVVQGKVSVREYEVDGQRRYSTEITAAAVGPDLARCAVQVLRRRAHDDEAADDAPVVPSTPPAPVEAGSPGRPLVEGAGEQRPEDPAVLPAVA